MMSDFAHKDSLEFAGDIREEYFAWLTEMEGVSIEKKVENIDATVAVKIKSKVKDLPF